MSDVTNCYSSHYVLVDICPPYGNRLPFVLFHISQTTCSTC